MIYGKRVPILFRTLTIMQEWVFGILRGAERRGDAKQQVECMREFLRLERAKMQAAKEQS